MLKKLMRGLFERQAAYEFEPVYSFEQLGAIGRLPIVMVLPFTPLHASSKGENAGPGVGAALANLVRRGLLLTRRFSVLDSGDSGAFAEPGLDVREHQEWLSAAFESAGWLVQGVLLEGAEGLAVRLDVVLP